MPDDVDKLYEIIMKEFPEKTIGEKADLIIRGWLRYLENHMNIHACEEIRRIAIIRAIQILHTVAESMEA